MDSEHTSAKVRAAAVKAIREFNRPISAHELESWISENDKTLSNEISERCYDYVRIILSLTPNTILGKYKAYKSIPGVDKRAAFYGLADHPYDDQIWKTVTKRKGSKSRHNRPIIHTQEKTKLPPPSNLELKSSIFYQHEYSAKFMQNVDDDQYWYAWNILIGFIPLTDQFWTTFLQAVRDMEKSVQSGTDPETVLQEILRKYPSLNYPVLIPSVVTVLSKTALNRVCKNII